MFDRIAPIYDLMNTVMTGGLDARWRRRAARAAALTPGTAVVDVACGSGALTVELGRRVGPHGRVVGVDVSTGMLERARTRRLRDTGAQPEYRVADALALPYPDADFDAATIAFGLRNVADYERCLSEMCRVTRPGGRVVVLEITTPDSGVGRVVAATWLGHVVPRVGRLAGAGSAYRYLADSVRGYPGPGTIAAALERAGAREVHWQPLWPRLVTLHAARV